MKRVSRMSAMALAISVIGCVSAFPSYQSAGHQNRAGARMPNVGFKPYVPQVNSVVSGVLSLSVLCFAPNSAFAPPIPTGPAGSRQPNDSSERSTTTPTNSKAMDSRPNDARPTELLIRDKEALGCEK